MSVSTKSTNSNVKSEPKEDIVTGTLSSEKPVEEVARDIGLHFIRSSYQQRAFTKRMRRYELGIFLLPEHLGAQLKDCMDENVRAIQNDGRSGKDAVKDVMDKWGPLRTDCEMRRLFAEATYQSDLEGENLLGDF